MVQLERTAIERALRESGDNIGTAARHLGASRRTLQNRMREYGMPRGRAGRRKRRLPYGRGTARAFKAVAIAAGLVLGYRIFRRGSLT